MSEENPSREVLDAKRRLEGIVTSAMDAIITIDEQQRIILFNPAAELMFGVVSDQVLGKEISRFIPERFRAGHDDHIRRFRETGVTGRRMGALGAISGVRADGQEFPIEASISQIDVGTERLATVILRDITERIANEEARLLLAREVDHRAKNALAVVQAVVSLTTAPTKEAFVDAVVGRVEALGRAHSLLAQNRWKGADFGQILTDETGAYGEIDQIQRQGPAITLTPNTVQPISLLVHELATNAVKYGALSLPSGKVKISWRVEPMGDLEIEWREFGGPPTHAPDSKGFGSTLITTAARQLGGRIEVEWKSAGVHVTAHLPAANFRVERPEPRPPQLTGVDYDVRQVNQNSRRLFIAEDELLVAMQLSNAMQADGWDVIGPAGTLEEAFGLLAANDPPDVAILDINLHGKLVYSVADVLQAKGVPIVFNTGYETPDHGDRYRFCPTIRKPTNLGILRKELARLLDGG